jgi:hypothetical protein
MIFNRRLRFALIIIASHILLIALAVAWLIQMLVININGSVKFVEYNRAILSSEIVLIALVCLFGIFVLYLQIKKLGEKRVGDGNRRNSDPQ